VLTLPHHGRMMESLRIPRQAMMLLMLVLLVLMLMLMQR
jgi:hypothetical protein